MPHNNCSVNIVCHHYIKLHFITGNVSTHQAPSPWRACPSVLLLVDRPAGLSVAPAAPTDPGHAALALGSTAAAFKAAAGAAAGQELAPIVTKKAKKGEGKDGAARGAAGLSVAILGPTCPRQNTIQDFGAALLPASRCSKATPCIPFSIPCMASSKAYSSLGAKP